MAYKGVIRWNVRCPHHPRFSPERNGPGAIKGGCVHCQRLVDLQRAALEIRKVSVFYGNRNSLSDAD